MLNAPSTSNFEVSAYGNSITHRADWGAWSANLDTATNAANADYPMVSDQLNTDTKRPCPNTLNTPTTRDSSASNSNEPKPSETSTRSYKSPVSKSYSVRHIVPNS